jgi:hypothetical protein
MADLLSLELTPPVYPVSGVGMGGRSLHSARGTYTITAALALNDTIQLFDMPVRIKADDLDTGGTALRINVGDVGDTSRYFVGGAGTPGPVAGVSNDVAAAGIDYLTTKKTRVYATIATGPTTGATTGTLTVCLFYTNEEPA